MKSVIRSLRRNYWRVRYVRWPRRRSAIEPGYAVLVPVPGDLPVMTRVALAILRQQSSGDRISTLVIPDQDSDDVATAVREAAPDWPGDLQLVPLAPVERRLLTWLRDPGKNHAAQLCRGVAATSATHVIFHDADLFLVDPGLHQSLWSTCASNGAAVCGLEEAWDGWFTERGRSLVATWELCCDVSWLRHFRPSQHFAHVAEADGEDHVFDTTLWPQWRTDPDKLLRLERNDDFVHFNYVISTYRHYQRSSGPFHDAEFRLLVLRVMMDLFGRPDDADVVPTLDELAVGLQDRSRRVFYLPADVAQYRLMRDRLQTILSGPWLPDRSAEAGGALRLFDDWADSLDESR